MVKYGFKELKPVLRVKIGFKIDKLGLSADNGMEFVQLLLKPIFNAKLGFNFLETGFNYSNMF